MSKRTLLAIGAVAALGVIAVVLIWFQPQTLLINREVNDEMPDIAAAGSSEPGASEAPGGADSGSGGGAVATGAFAALSHETTGTASLLRGSDGRHILRFENLSTDNGPDLRVYLTGAPADGPPDAFDDDFVDLGPLKGNRGNQNYELPADVDPAQFRSAVIWCRRFSVGFGVAPLGPATG